MAEWTNRPLDQVNAAIFIDAIMVKVRDGQVANRPIYAAIGVSLAGRKTFSGCGPGPGTGALGQPLHGVQINGRGPSG